MRSDGRAAEVIIIGGGYSGTMVAAELARRGVPSVLVEKEEREGRGTAYSTTENAHLLNVAAGRMGAWADKPGDFAETVAAEGRGPHDFVPRRRFGEYLSSILQRAEASGLVKVVHGAAQSVEQTASGWAVGLTDGSRIEGQALVLAQGNQAPADLPFARNIPDALFVNDPWSEAGRQAVARTAAGGGDVLMIGTGLTMVDVVLSLDEAAHRGRIVALSRRGLAPRAHASTHEVAPIDWSKVPNGSVTGLLRWMRKASAAHEWHTLMEALRPHNWELWQALDLAEQQRFLRHARPWWDVHRHRIAPEVAQRMRRLIETGRLEIVAGRIEDMWIEEGELRATVARRGRPISSPPHPREGSKFAVAVNCTGPLGSISASKDPLLSGLFEQGLARPDALDLGLEVDDMSRIAGAERAWAVGPLTKGKWWEITAVPDIRGQVAKVAGDIAKELEHAVQS